MSPNAETGPADGDAGGEQTRRAVRVTPADERRVGAQPTLTAPAHLVFAVADVARTVAFYRDVLGFEERPGSDEFELPVAAELVCGPVRVQLLQASPRGPGNAPRAVLFFQTDDVAGWHAQVTARGGQPSARARVNWLKYEVFEVRDPDGHTLWFGQSYNRPDLHRSDAMMVEALPELPCDDVAAAVTYYRDVLGFAVNYQQHDLGVMYRDRVTVLLVPRGRPGPGPAAAEFYVRDADALYAELVGRGAQVQGEPVSHPWGLRDFTVLDLAGNRLIFAQPFE